MSLTQLQVRGLRILRDVRMDPVQGLNLIHGQNGAGKTSLLEAIHLLSTGHSFRTRQLQALLPVGSESLEVVARVMPPDGGEPWPVGLRKSKDKTLLRIRGQTASTLAELARVLPVQAMHPESHVLISGAPGHRRAFMDWGAFHADPDFHRQWRRYRHLLEQRNAVLKDRGDERLLSSWDAALSEAGEALDQVRRAHVFALGQILDGLKQALPETRQLTLAYRRGWSAETSLGDVLAQSRARDRVTGFTQSGPHRAELAFRIDGRPAAQVASRGQQKSVVMLLKLAQCVWMRSQLGSAPVVIIDDLPSELDSGHRDWVLGLLAELGAQVFVTAIEVSQVSVQGWDQVKMFHVEHGELGVSR